MSANDEVENSIMHILRETGPMYTDDLYKKLENVSRGHAWMYLKQMQLDGLIKISWPHRMLCALIEVRS